VSIYVSRPQMVAAFQWLGPQSEDDLIDGFLGAEGVNGRVRFVGDDLELMAGVGGAQGWVPVPVGHWIVRKPGDFSDHWPVDPDYFAAKYEPASNDDHMPGGDT